MLFELEHWLPRFRRSSLHHDEGARGLDFETSESPRTSANKDYSRNVGKGLGFTVRADSLDSLCNRRFPLLIRRERHETELDECFGLFATAEFEFDC